MGLFAAAYFVWAVIWNFREQRRHRALAKGRPELDAEEFSRRMVEQGVNPAIAEFFWKEFQVYYFKPLTPYPTDRIYGDLKIDPEDMSYLAADYEEKFGVDLGRELLESPHDPSIAELALSLQRASAPVENA